MPYSIHPTRPSHGLVYAVILLVSCTVAAAAPQGQLRAYASLILADEARDEGAWEEAHEGYGKALQLYREIHENDPAWQPEIVQYRIGYCLDQQAALAPRLVAEPALPAATGSEPGDGTNDVALGYAEKAHALAGENVYLRGRLRDLEAELDQALATDSDATNVTAALRESLAAAEARLEAARSELAACREDAKSSQGHLQSALGAARLEHSETMQANLDLLRQLEAAAEEHLRLTKALEDAGLDVPITRVAPPGEPGEPMDVPEPAKETPSSAELDEVVPRSGR